MAELANLKDVTNSAARRLASSMVCSMPRCRFRTLAFLVTFTFAGAAVCHCWQRRTPIAVHRLQVLGGVGGMLQVITALLWSLTEAGVE